MTPELDRQMKFGMEEYHHDHSAGSCQQQQQQQQHAETKLDDAEAIHAALSFDNDRKETASMDAFVHFDLQDLVEASHEGNRSHNSNSNNSSSNDNNVDALNSLPPSGMCTPDNALELDCKQFPWTAEDAIPANANGAASAAISSTSIGITTTTTTSSSSTQRDVTPLLVASKRRLEQEQQQQQQADNNKSTTTTNNNTNNTSFPCTRRKKKPKGMPKRVLSAYNLFYQSERERIQTEAERTGKKKVGFEGLAKLIAKKWKTLTPKELVIYQRRSKLDSERYQLEMKAWNRGKTEKLEQLQHSDTNYEELVSFAKQQQQSATTTSSQIVSPISTYATNNSNTDTPNGNAYMFNTNHTHPYGMATSPVAQSPSMQQQQQQQQQHHPNGTHPHSTNANMINHNHHHHQMMAHPHMSMPVLTDKTTADVLLHSFPLHTDNLQHPVTSEYPNDLPVPPAMQISLDRQYTVQFQCRTMTPDSAQQYIQSTINSNSNNHHQSTQFLHHNNEDHIPLPPGMEVLLPHPQTGQERKYRLQMHCYSMSYNDAQQFCAIQQQQQNIHGPSSIMRSEHPSSRQPWNSQQQLQPSPPPPTWGSYTQQGDTAI